MASEPDQRFKTSVALGLPIQLIIGLVAIGKITKEEAFRLAEFLEPDLAASGNAGVVRQTLENAFTGTTHR